MSTLQKVEEILRGYKYNKARASFLESQLGRLTPEAHEDYIEYKMYAPGYSGASPKFVMEKGMEVAQLNKVEETAQEYRTRCESEFKLAKEETRKEIKELTYYTAMVEDGLNTLERINKKYRMVIEGYYINGTRMEDIADLIHISRSRCYEMCKEGVKLMTRLIFGDNSVA